MGGVLEEHPASAINNRKCIFLMAAKIGDEDES
jgi:hypothetical protein